MTPARLLPWVLRVSWAVLPFTAGPGLAGALDGRDAAVRTTPSIGLWALWALVLVATLVPHPVALTAVRVAVPAGAVASGVAALTGHTPLGAAWWVVVVAAAFAPESAMTFVNGPAYPNERRFPLRAPAPLLLAPVPLSWAAVVGLPVAGGLLLAAQQWVLGGLVLAVGLPVAGVLARSLHGLARRWVVFVPAGVVVHDELALADPILFQRRGIAGLRPAPAGTDAQDLTQRALGLALELALTEPVQVHLATPGNRAGRAVSPTALLFTPTRPGAVLAEAERRRIPR
jgi:hypothetical protein